MVYTGTPADILNSVSKQVANALEQSGMPPTGIHALAILHVACSIMRNHKNDALMPSFKMTLATFMHSLNGTEFTPESAVEFNREFARMVESLGGTTTLDQKEQVKSNPTWVAPMGEC